MPSPVDVPAIKGTNPETGEEDERPSDPKAPFSSLAFKIMTDTFVGKLTYLRVYSGTLESGSYVVNASKDRKSASVVFCRCTPTTVSTLTLALLATLLL